MVAIPLKKLIAAARASLHSSRKAAVVTLYVWGFGELFADCERHLTPSGNRSRPGVLNREGLDVLVHPLTESSYDDHSKNALWLGTPVPMKLDILRPTYRAELLPKDAPHPA
jgi:hypothetical protein